MTIIRNGQRFELTPNELFNAYREQQFEFDVESVRDYIECVDGGSELNDDYFVEEAASELRRNIDKYNMSYDYALSEAVGDVRRRFARGCDNT